MHETTKCPLWHCKTENVLIILKRKEKTFSNYIHHVIGNELISLIYHSANRRKNSQTFYIEIRLSFFPVLKFWQLAHLVNERFKLDSHTRTLALVCVREKLESNLNLEAIYPLIRVLSIQMNCFK